jgi:hypothetical protein
MYCGPGTCLENELHKTVLGMKGISGSSFGNGIKDLNILRVKTQSLPLVSVNHCLQFFHDSGAMNATTLVVTFL